MNQTVQSHLCEREKMSFDVLIIGAGAAGLSAAIRLKQNNSSLSVCVLEKGSEVGAHILSGAVLDPCGLDMLIPDWKVKGAPLHVPVKHDSFHILGPAGNLRLPNMMLPSQLHNKGNYIVSMAQVCRWLAQQAEELGVEIFPGFSAGEPVYSADQELIGVVAGECGLDKDAQPTDAYEPGMELHARYILVAEGARGSLAKQIIEKYALHKNAQPQKYGLGLKEIWDIPAAQHDVGHVMHTVGWPLKQKTGGGGFLYHMDNNQLAVGFVVHLDYENPYISPYEEFQQFKHHPVIKDLFKGGKRVGYGARVISEGGWQSLPRLDFPGGALLGCAAGMVNVPRIKGNHNAMLSGIAAADAVCTALASDKANFSLEAYNTAVRKGEIGKELRRVRNIKPLWSRYGLFGGLFIGGLDLWTRGIMPTVRHKSSDAACLKQASQFKQIRYPKPDSVVSFDLLTNLAYSFTNHAENQPSHLKLKDPSIPINYNLPVYAEPAQRYCPAGVYEVVYKNNTAVFQINAQNCIHCKACDIKDPSQNIIWTVPEGGGGPNYTNM